MNIEKPTQDGNAGQQTPADMEQLIAEHQAALLRYAAGIVGNPHAAQDIVQNVFIKFFTHNPGPDMPAAAARYWLFRVTHNVAIDYLRSETRRSILHRKQIELYDETVKAKESDAQNELKEQKEIVLKLMGRLKPAERQVILLRMQQGLSYGEISRVTGRSIGNVGCVLHNAVKRLASLLKNRD